MSTTPSTFNKIYSSYTVIGGNKGTHGKSEGLSVLILNRGGRPYREALIKEIIKLDITELLIVEKSLIRQRDYEKECLDNDKLRFLLFKDIISTGEVVNIGIQESSSTTVLVLWDDMFIDSKMMSYRVFDKIKDDGRLCTVPQIKNSNNSIIPTLMTPLFNKGLLKVVPSEDNETLKTLYPYQFTGIYNKDLFNKLGGFDIRMDNDYWQIMDFGLRAYMWGERIIMHKNFIINFTPKNNQIDDITPDFSYRLYSLKNLSITIKKGVGVLSGRRFFSFYDKLGYSLFESLRAFRQVKRWVKKNRSRFLYSAPEVTKEWDQG